LVINFIIELFFFFFLIYYILSLIYLIFIPEKNIYKIQKLALKNMCSLFIIFIYIFYFYLIGYSGFILFIKSYVKIFPLFISTNIYIHIFFSYLYFFIKMIITLQIFFNLIFYYDSIAFIFIFLILFIFPLCVFFNSTKIYKYKQFILFLIFLEFILILCFLVINLFSFYILFESSLILMFFIIGIWGSRARKIKAAYYFFFYTLFGSIFMFIALFLLYFFCGTFHILILMKFSFSNFYIELLIWFCLFIPFAIKIPVFPFHLWLLEAHVEAPTVGSVILASILLKLGSYGILRFLFSILLNANLYFRPLIFLLSFISILIASFSALRQIDLKKIIAYSSIAHMNVILFGIYSLNIQGIKGSLFLMLGHGFISAALFFLIGIIYERAHTRLLPYLTGLVNVMPLFATYFFLFSFANISFPGTVNFISEILIFYSIIIEYKFLAILLIFSTFCVVLFLILLLNKLIFGNLYYKIIIFKFNDLSIFEHFILLCLFIMTLLFGFFPNPILQILHIDCFYLLFNYFFIL
jgi:NADH-quinone oxidoreductase subunit M